MESLFVGWPVLSPEAQTLTPQGQLPKKVGSSMLISTFGKQCEKLI